MRPTARRWIVILAVALVSSLCWQGLAASGPDRSPPGVFLPPLWGDPPPALPSGPLSPGLPRAAFALAALTQDARTHMVAVLASDHQPVSGPEVLDERSIAFRGRVLAYLVLAGLDPAGNYIETHDLDAGPSWRIQPDEGGVIFGFALHPEGFQLTYLEVDSRPSGTRPPWRVVTVDLASGNRRTILDSAAQPDALLPLDWQGDTLLLRAVVPFTARHLGLWAATSDGSGLRPILEESSFVGAPRLSPHGDRLAVLRPDPSSIPTTFDPGEPVATTIWAIDLASGKETLIASAGDGHDFADMAWESGGLVAVRGEWDDDRNTYVHRSIIRLSSEAGSASQIVYSIEAGEILRLLGCSEHAWMATVRVGETTQLVQGNPSKAVTEFASGNLHWAACPPGPREGMAHARPGEPSP